MAKIKKVQPLVYEALVNNPETRGDDFLLIYEVLKHFVTPEFSLESVLKHHVELGIPSFASIIRIRRKIQENNPELEDEKKREIRNQEQEEFKAYALNN
jgi:hypothetical protein